MIGIKNIGSYIPEKRISNFEDQSRFDINKEFLEKKIGVHSVARKQTFELTSDLCISAFKDLLLREQNLELSQIDFVCVCTQNGDYQLPHTSAVVTAKLGCSLNCAAFDISLGCSGYVYSLLVAKSFMETNNMKLGLVFTSDPYSLILDPNDKSTSLLFGDAATVTLLNSCPVFTVGQASFDTDGNRYDDLIKHKNQALQMNGRGIFDFAMKHVPENVRKCLKKNELEQDNVDAYILHQASKYVIDNLVRRMKLNPCKVPFAIQQYGNTISSTIPLLLKDYVYDDKKTVILLCGFGVGLSVASLIIRRL